MPVKSVVRVSKFRHVYGQPAKKEKCFENIRLTKNAFDSNLSSTNGKYVAVCWQASGGGSFAVLPTDQLGKLPDRFPLFDGHKGPVLDTAWNPFDDSMVVSASDDGTIGVWKVPEDFDLHKEYESLEAIKDVEPVKFLKGHTKRVGHVEFNPVAKDILASSSVDNTIKIWNVETGKVLYTLKHPQFVTSFDWNYDGTKLVTACKDKRIRVWDVRAEKVISEGSGHAGAKGSRVIWLGDNDRILTTGFSLMSDREMALWDTTDIAKGPIGGFRKQANPSSGIVMPFYDVGTSIVYLGGRGDGNIVYYEFVDDELHDLFAYSSTSPQRGLAFLPENKLDAANHEVARFYKVHESFVEPIPFYVPRKVEGFLEDIYKDVASDQPALTAEEWASGKTSRPLVVSWEDVIEGRSTKPSAAKPKEESKKEAKEEPKKEESKKETKTDEPTKEVKKDEPKKEESKKEESKKAQSKKEVSKKEENGKSEEILAQQKAEKQDSYDVLQSKEVKSFLAKAEDGDEAEEAGSDHDSAWDEAEAEKPVKSKTPESAEPEAVKSKSPEPPKSEAAKSKSPEPTKTESVKSKSPETKSKSPEAEVKKSESETRSPEAETKKSEVKKTEDKAKNDETVSLAKTLEKEIQKIGIDDSALEELADGGAKALHVLHKRVNELETTIAHTLKELIERVENLEKK